MSAAHTRAVAPAPVHAAVPFAALLARHGLPADAPLPPRAVAYALAAFVASPRHVGYSEPPRAMSAARRECEARRRVLLVQARAIAAGVAP